MSTVRPPIRQTLRGAHLVVTGATGFVGKVWLSHLLTHVPEIGRVTLLVRGRRTESATARVARLFDTSPAFRPLRERHGAALGTWLDERVEVVDAELTTPGLGLDPATTDRLASTADLLVHIAGLTQFHPDPRKGVPVNVRGTLHAAELASRFRAPRFLHVSTAFVAGVADGVVAEELRPGVSPRGIVFDPQAELAAAEAIIASVADVTERTDRVAERARELGWPNLYTFTKGLAEHLLATTDLELAIARPSVVEASRTFPFPAWNEDLNTSSPICWFCGTAFPVLPADPDHVFDIIPVDAVCRALTILAARQLEGTAGVVHHLATGDVNPATFRRITELTALGKRRHAARPGAGTWEKVEAWVDVVPRRREDAPLLTPERAEGWATRLGDALERLAATGPLAGPLGAARTQVRRQQRTLGRLRRMLEQYQPFIHDHDWRFVTESIRTETARLHPDDHEAFADDLTSLCWRSYWLDVQYPAMVRWAFPILEGTPIPQDPPSVPPLVLGATSPAWAQPDAEQVA